MSALCIGRGFKFLGLPLISGFLFTGMIFGPFFLNYIDHETIKNIHFVDDIALGFIALSAGAELHFSELKGRIKSILLITTFLVMCTMSVGVLGFYLLSGWVPFTSGMAPIEVFSISLLVGVILVARSPSAAIAIINELKAKGPFTQTILGVTVLMDVVVITLFAINLSIADVLIKGEPLNLSFLSTLTIDIIGSLMIGALLTVVIRALLSIRMNQYVMGILILALGYSVFAGADHLAHWTDSQFQIHLKIEPLLLCMVSGIFLSNFTQSSHRLMEVLSSINVYVYLAFFTLIGASLEFDILSKLWPIALVIFFIRLIGIFLGSYFGGYLSKEPKRQNRLRWMGFITQAGVGLGLAKEVASHFPDWGPSFATLIISVIVINEMIGPIFFKWVIHLVDEVGISKNELTEDSTESNLS